MMIDVLRPLLCIWQVKWAERPPKVMKRSQRWNTLSICLHRDSNSGGSDLWSNALPTRPEAPFCWNTTMYLTTDTNTRQNVITLFRCVFCVTCVGGISYPIISLQQSANRKHKHTDAYSTQKKHCTGCGLTADLSSLPKQPTDTPERNIKPTLINKQQVTRWKLQYT